MLNRLDKYVNGSNFKINSQNLSLQELIEIGRYLHVNQFIYTLTLEGCQLSSANVAGLLSHLPSSIAFLNLNRNQFNNYDAKIFAANTTLITLALSNNLIGNGAVHFADNTQLLELHLENNGIRDEDVVSLATNSTLTSLNMANNYITSVGSRALFKMPSLRKLSLYENKLTYETAVDFVSNTSITDFCIGKNYRIGDDGINAIARNDTLLTLHAGEMALTSNAVRNYKFNTTLTLLNLKNNNISEEGALALAENNAITTLVLSNNQIGDIGAKYLAEKNQTINTLDISDNNITSHGALQLANNMTLKCLYVRTNKINDFGACAFTNNTTLEYLDISRNRLTDLGVSSLQKNSTFQVCVDEQATYCLNEETLKQIVLTSIKDTSKDTPPVSQPLSKIQAEALIESGKNYIDTLLGIKQPAKKTAQVKTSQVSKPLTSEELKKAKQKAAPVMVNTTKRGNKKSEEDNKFEKINDLTSGSNITFSSDITMSTIDFMGPKNELLGLKNALKKVKPVPTNKECIWDEKSGLAKLILIKPINVINNWCDQAKKTLLSEIAKVNNTNKNKYNTTITTTTSTTTETTTETPVFSTHDIDNLKKQIHTLFCKSEELKISWESNSFIIYLPINDESWTVKDTHGNANKYIIHAEIFQEMRGRIKKHFADEKEAIVFDESVQLRIRPKVKEFSEKSKLHEEIYNQISKACILVATESNFIPNLLTNPQKPKPSNTPSSKTINLFDETKKLFAAIIDDPNQQFHFLIVEQKNKTDQPVKKDKKNKKTQSEKNDQTEQKNTEEQKCIINFKFASAKAFYQKDAAEVFEVIASAIGKIAPDFITTYPHDNQQGVKIVINNSNDSLNKLLDKLDELKETYRQHQFKHIGTSQIATPKTATQKSNHKDNEDSNAANGDLATQIQITNEQNFIKCLEQINQIPVPGSHDESMSTLHYLSFLGLVTRVFDQLSQNEADNKFRKYLFNDWRNVIRHAYDRLDWINFYKLVYPVVETLLVQSKNPSTLFATKVIDRQAIRNLQTALDPFREQIKKMTLRKKGTKSYETLQAQLQELKAYQLTSKDYRQQNWLQKATLVIHAMIGELPKSALPASSLVDSYISTKIYGELGHNFSDDFEQLCHDLYHAATAADMDDELTLKPGLA